MFLQLPPLSESVTALYESARAEDGYVDNLTKLWSWRPDVMEAFTELRKQLAARSTLSDRERAVLVCATASSIGDAYCALAWGRSWRSKPAPGPRQRYSRWRMRTGLPPASEH